MKIVIPTIGTRGDVQPFIALAQGLDRAGHEVTVATHPVMKTLVEAHHVKFAPIGPDINLGEEVAAIRLRSRNTAVGLVQGMRFSFDMLEKSHEDILEQCRETDLVVVSAQSAAGKNEADQLNRPYLSVTLMPWAIPWDDVERPLIKRMAYGLIDRIVGLITTRPLNRIRKRQGLPPVGKDGFTSTRLNLVTISPVIYEPNPHWDQHHHVVGYWFVEPLDEWKPSADLYAFLESGEPPLLVSLGAMSLGEGDALKTASMFVESIQKANVRAIIQGWESGLQQLTLPESIFAAGNLPHGWLLPCCAGVVHHGGFGTTSAGLRAGIPALVIPHVIDQFYWGQRIYELGVGPQAIRRTELDVDGLAAALVELVGNSDYRTQAAILGEQIRTENGIENAVRLIEETFE